MGLSVALRFCSSAERSAVRGAAPPNFVMSTLSPSSLSRSKVLTLRRATVSIDSTTKAGSVAPLKTSPFA